MPPLSRGPFRSYFPFLPDEVLVRNPATAAAAATNPKVDGMSTISGKFDSLSLRLSSTVVSKGSGFDGPSLGRSKQSLFADEEEPPVEDRLGGNKTANSDMASVLLGCNRIKARRSAAS